MTSRYLIGIALVASAAVPSLGGTVTPYFGQDFGTPQGTRPATIPQTRAAQNSFLARLNGASTESFEGFAQGTLAPLNLSFTGSGPALSATLSGSGSQVVGNLSNQIYPTHGNNTLFASSDSTGGLTIDFGQGTAAFGFTATDVGDFGVQIALELTNGAIQNISIPYATGSNGSTNANALFFGVVAEDFEFTRVRFIITGGGSFDSFGFDEMTIGDRQQVQMVPLPPAAGAGLAGLALVALRIRRKSAR